MARWLPDAHAAVQPIDRVSVWARSAGKAQALARGWRGCGLNAQAVAELEPALRAADIVSCTTLSAALLVQGRWLRAGSHLDLMGSFASAMREADDDCFRGAALYVDSDEALRKSGDLAGPLSRGIVAEGELRGTLASLARGSAALRVQAGRHGAGGSGGRAAGLRVTRTRSRLGGVGQGPWMPDNPGKHGRPLHAE